MKRLSRTGCVVAGMAAVALSASAVPAGAAASASPDTGVPAGKVEHMVWDISASGSYEVSGVLPWHQRTESWVATDRIHQLLYDSTSGKLMGENYQSATEGIQYDGASNTVYRMAPAPGAIGDSRKQAGDHRREELSDGRMVKAGTTTFQGRTVLEIKSPGDASGDRAKIHGKGINFTRVRELVDPVTLAPYRTIADVTDTQGRTLHQVGTLVSYEVVAQADLPAGALAMYAHPGAKQVDRDVSDEKAASAARRRAAARKAKALAKKQRKAKQKQRRASKRTAER